MNKILGDKQILAIEMGGYTTNKKKGKLRFWIENKSFGTFDTAFSFQPAIKAFEKIINEGNNLYDETFDNKIQEEIFKLSILSNADLFDLTEDDYSSMEKYQRFGFYFGDQFDNITNTIYVKNNICYFLWTTTHDFISSKIDDMQNFQFAKTPLNELKNIYEQFKIALGA